MFLYVEIFNIHIDHYCLLSVEWAPHNRYNSLETALKAVKIFGLQYLE